MTPDEIKTLRQQLGLTQAQLAEKLDTYQATVGNWETGKYPISKSYIRRLQKLLITI